MLVTRIWQTQPGKFFCISTKTGTGTWRDHFFTRPQFKDIPQFLKDHSDRDIYFCPAGLRSPSRKKDEAVCPNLLWADLDEADPRKIKPKPTIAFESSPGRFVGLWIIDAPMTAELNRRLTYAVGADKSGWDLTQVLRFPGTVNYKYAATPKVRTLWSDGESYRLADIERVLPDTKTAGSGDENTTSAIYKRLEKKLPAWARRELLHGQPKAGQRSDMLWKLENLLIERGATRDEAFTLLWACPWNKFRARADGEAQLRRELDKAVNNKFEPTESHAPRIVMRPMSEVEEEQIDWLYYPYLALSEVTLVEGDPGLGKSYMMQMVSAAICDGKQLPCIKKHMKVRQGKVVYFDLENSAASVTKKRLVSNGVKHFENYIQCEEPFSIDDEDAMNIIFDHLERYRPLLVVFDTINTYLGSADAYKGHEAQQMFIKFKEIAKRFNCSVVALRHLTKSTKERALYRGQGSIAFAAIARVVMAVASMPDDPDTRVMAVSKANFTRTPQALTFSINSIPDTLREQDRSRFEWGDFVDKSADDILSAPPAKANTDREDAKEFLTDQLNGHAVDAEKLQKMAEARAISLRTLQRAADDLGVIKKLQGAGKTRFSMWSMPQPSD